MLDCRCLTSQNYTTSRTRFQQSPPPLSGQGHPNKKSAPLAMKILDLLGLRSYIFNKFIFRKTPPKYSFIDASEGAVSEANKLFCIGESRQPQVVQGYNIRAQILQQNDLCVPVVLLQLSDPEFACKPYLIYSHGNSSDLSDAFLFFKKLVAFIRFNIVVYDYSGYGISKAQTTEESVCADLDLVISWLKVDKQQIILWGFSLGSFPTASAASKSKFAGVILQSPIASGACFFDDEEEVEEGVEDYTYDFDCLDNLSSMKKIESEVIIIHSSSDEIIPVQHAVKLYNTVKKHSKHPYAFLEVDKIRHNEMHYFLSASGNQLNQIFIDLMAKLGKKVQQRTPLSEGVKVTKRSLIIKNRRHKAEKEKKRGNSPDRQSANLEEDWQITQEDGSIGNHNDILEIGVKNHRNYFGIRNSTKPTFSSNSRHK